ncbi:50S ribosomal protein L33 [Paenibacillus arenosi]|uniref:50S ribosomal protein L33 n=1 Tax=Paenibacillus arenosi TaxID=2774142 RepID=A0ABR9AXZ8_9BACL|nr:50S ribosomal protein L33 [Paenibacillus arenosi]MBD8498761.1 50S ribosomal protein L33 [Paenibacillus arenosi]
MQHVTKSQAEKLIGQHIYAVRQDGKVVSGKLVRISGNELVLTPADGKARTRCFLLPLILFDLLAIGTLGCGGGFGFGPFGGPFGGGGCGGCFGPRPFY